MNREDEIMLLKCLRLMQGIPCYCCEKLITIEEWFEHDAGWCNECWNAHKYDGKEWVLEV